MKGSDDQAEIRERLHRVLQELRDRGTTQQQIASCIGVASQYLSDVKSGQKRVTKLFALRLGACYGFDHEWLMRGGDPPPLFFGLDPQSDRNLHVALCVFDDPISGDPWSRPRWTPTAVEVSGPAAQQADRAQEPYILSFAGRDPEGELRPNDLIMVSQKVNPHAKFHVVRKRDELVLARKTKNGIWRRVADGLALGRKVKAVGHCVGIVWRQL
jgi:transcriptional regulator with XRE-family HTH domain